MGGIAPGRGNSVSEEQTYFGFCGYENARAEPLRSPLLTLHPVRAVTRDNRAWVRQTWAHSPQMTE